MPDAEEQDRRADMAAEIHDDAHVVEPRHRVEVVGEDLADGRELGDVADLHVEPAAVLGEREVDRPAGGPAQPAARREPERRPGELDARPWRRAERGKVTSLCKGERDAYPMTFPMSVTRPRISSANDPNCAARRSWGASHNAS